MTDIAEWLKSKGAEETIFDAIQSDNSEQIQALLNSDPGYVGAFNRNGRTPLMQAVMRTNQEVAVLLLAHGARADARDWEGMTALHFAAARNQVGLGELLLKSGANPNAMSARVRLLHCGVDAPSSPTCCCATRLM
jgi:ankyrin repeat protein